MGPKNAWVCAFCWIWWSHEQCHGTPKKGQTLNALVLSKLTLRWSMKDICPQIRLSTGRSESVLASTRTQPAQIGWNKNTPAIDLQPPRVESAELREANGRVGRVWWWVTVGRGEVLSSPIWVDGAGSNGISPDSSRSEPNLTQNSRI